MSDYLAVARLTIARDKPYYAAVLWAFQPVPVKDFAKLAPGPMGVDQHLRLYYDPAVIDTWTPPILAGVLEHEIGHVLRGHAGRCGDRDKLIWNIAGDCEINDDLVAEKVPLPEWVVTPSTYKLPDGLLAEEYYDKLPVTYVKVSGAGGGACGSIGTGWTEAYEVPEEGNGQVPRGVSQAEAELMRQRVAEDVVSHAKQRGTVPDWLQRWAKDRLTSKVDWRRVLAAHIRRACGQAQGAIDYTYQRLGRRNPPGILLPALRQPVPHVAIVVDTSGSMSEKELSQCLAEIAKVLEAGGHRSVDVLSCDAAVHTTQKIFRPDQVRLQGGGGTDMGVGIAAAAALRPKPHVIICCTDGETPYPATAPSVPVIVARTQKSAHYPVPSYATVIDIVPVA